MAVGLRLGYTNTRVDVNNANLMDALKLSNKHVVNSLFTGALAFRAYLPMFNSKIFALFAEARLTGGFGYGKIIFDKEMTAYEPFHLDITYRNERTPKYITIVCSSSNMGDYFTGGSGSVLYLDEFKLLC